MSKLLSQEEIDALLSQEQGNDKTLDSLAPQKELRLYDFRRPERVSKDQIKILRNIHGIFARLLAPYLSNTLRTMVDIKSPVIDQVTYLEFTMSASDYTNMYIFEVEQLDGQALLDIDPDFTFFIIDRLFGGTGNNIARSADNQDLTEIERSVLKNIASTILNCFKEAWAQIDTLDPKLIRFESKPQLVTIAASSETMIVLNFPVAARNFEFTILLCFPYFMMEPVLKKLLTQNYMTLFQKEATQEDRLSLKHTMEHTSVGTSIELGNTEISVQEFLMLEEGNILLLDRQIDDYLVGKIADVPRFLGTVGKQKKKMAFQIKHLIDQEGEIINE